MPNVRVAYKNIKYTGLFVNKFVVFDEHMSLLACTVHGSVAYDGAMESQVFWF